jgi:multiple sugar transport system permease protein
MNGQPANLVRTAALGLCLLFFALPLLWLIITPFMSRPSMAVELSTPTLQNFNWAVGQGGAKNLLPFLSSIIISMGSLLLVVSLASLGSYGLSRSGFRGKEAVLYGLVLLSSIVTGVAAMVPIYTMVLKLGLVDTYTGVILVFAGGYLPTALFILKDFMDGIPKSYEEAALVDGSSSFDLFFRVALPLARPGIAVVALLAFINAWSNFLVPFILFSTRATDKYPLAIAIFRFQDEMGLLQVGKISSYSLAYALPVLIVYLFISKRYGFGFFGGLKG